MSILNLLPSHNLSPPRPEACHYEFSVDVARRVEMLEGITVDVIDEHSSTVAAWVRVCWHCILVHESSPLPTRSHETVEP